MKIPRKFKFMGLPWQVEESDNMEPGTYGITKIKEQRIIIKKDLASETKEATFLHELLHIAVYQAGLDKTALLEDQRNEELVVNALSNVLYAMIQEGVISV